jgi:hypothetical protein
MKAKPNKEEESKNQKCSNLVKVHFDRLQKVGFIVGAMTGRTQDGTCGTVSDWKGIETCCWCEGNAAAKPRGQDA